MLLDNGPIAAFRFCPLLVQEGNAGQAHFQLGNKLFSRKIALSPEPLLAGAVQDDNSRRPEYVETLEICRRWFDVDSYGKEILVNEVCNFLVGIRFGLQPNTSASSGRSTEIKQDWFTAIFCFCQRCIEIFDPLHSHGVLHR